MPEEEADRLNVCPVHIGFGVADTVGVDGDAFTVTETVAALLVHPPVAAVTE